MANLFDPKTADACFTHDGEDGVIGIKNDANEWNMAGHLKRLVPVNNKILDLFARLYVEPGTPVGEVRLLALHSLRLSTAFEKFAQANEHLSALQDSYFSTQMWDETNAVKKDKIIAKVTGFAGEPREMIFSGPHIFAGSSFYKMPRAICTEKGGTIA